MDSDNSEKVPGLPVSGYRPQPAEAIAAVNASKEMEEHVLRLIDEIGEDTALQADKRWLSIGRTQIEQGFMAVNRAVFKPGRALIPALDEPIVETSWVLERADSSPAAPIYYAPRSQSQWSPDHEQALRLSREQDAAAVAAAIGVEVRIAEHEWEV